MQHATHATHATRNTGQGYATDTLEYIALARNTSFGPSSGTAALFVELLLDGMQWMSVGKYWDWSVKGRDLGGDARPLMFDTSTFSALPQRRHAELAAFAARIDGPDAGVGAGAGAGANVGANVGASAGASLVGHRAYWCSDYAVVHSISPYTKVPWMASIHMHSNRTVSARCKCHAKHICMPCVIIHSRHYSNKCLVTT